MLVEADDRDSLVSLLRNQSLFLGQRPMSLLQVICAVGPTVLASVMAALPAQAAGAGAELARPSTADSVQSVVNSVPSLLEPSTVDQAVNSVVDVVKVTLSTLCVKFFPAGLRTFCYIQAGGGAVKSLATAAGNGLQYAQQVIEADCICNMHND